MPCDLTVTADNAYRVVCPQSAANLPHVHAFVDWITTEYDKIRTLETGRRFVTAGKVPEGSVR